MSDYGGLGAIIAQALADAQSEHVDPSCPRCGEPLDVNAVGVRNCPLGHYRDNGRPL